MITTVGRPGTWLILIGVSLLFCCGLMLITVKLAEPFLPITPREALSNGGHTIVVYALCEGSNEPLDGGDYEVITQSGRRPDQETGELSGNMVQVVVGPDWIGQIKIEKVRIWSGDFVELTDRIGDPYGWHERTVVGTC
jgi:hypothetical protein